jgi:hypothetical protein
MRAKAWWARVALCWLTLCVAFAGALAQKIIYYPDKPGIWRPWKSGCSNRGFGLSAQQTTFYLSKLHKIAELVHQSPTFNPPRGIDAQPSGCLSSQFLDDYPGRDSGPVPGYLMVGTFSYFSSANVPTPIVGDEGPHFFIDVNSLVRLYSSLPEIARDNGGKIFAAPQVVRTLEGFPLYDSGSIVITKIPRPIFQPVSVERFLQARILKAQTELTAAQAERAKQAGSYDRWLAGREKRRQEREKSYQELKAIAPQNADNYLRIAEEGERKQEEIQKSLSLQAQSGPSSLEQSKQQELDGYRAELAALSADQRSAQAYFDPSHREIPGHSLADPRQPGAKPLASLNPNFFDRSRPRTDFQVFVVGWLYERTLHDIPDDPARMRIIEFRKTFDFHALLPFLD